MAHNLFSWVMNRSSLMFSRQMGLRALRGVVVASIRSGAVGGTRLTRGLCNRNNAMPGDTPAKIQKLENGDEFGSKSDNRVTLHFAKLSPNAFTPTRGSAAAAGYDLHSAYDYVLPAQGKIVALTDLQIALPDGCYGRVAPRSGLAAKHFIDVGAGVIDQDYRGNVGVVLFNFGQSDFEVKKGDRIAQLILERIFVPDLVELPTLDSTERGSGGFGSTGKS